MEDYQFVKELVFANLLRSYPAASTSLRRIVDVAFLKAKEEVLCLGNLRAELKNRVVHFAYRKVNGERREAWGTLNEILINAHDGGSEGRKMTNFGVFTYFDLERNAWRNFKIENFIEVL